jgi:integrase
MVKRSRVPGYLLHKPTGYARVRIAGKDIYLGKFDSPESREAYHRLIAEWLQTGEIPAKPVEPKLAAASAGPTINEFLVRYWAHCKTYYRDALGRPTKEQECVRYALRPLRQLYGSAAVVSFGPTNLKNVRQHLIAAKRCRTSINASMGRIKRAFKWGVESELVPAEVWHRLEAVAGLRAGRCDAVESEPVRPVSRKHVDAVLPFVSRQVAAMIELQWLTAMRPGEAVAMRLADIDMSGDVWVYAPSDHKTAWRGHRRQIYLGPKCKEILQPFLNHKRDAYLFSPAEAEADRRAERHAKRTTPQGYGNGPGTNRRSAPARPPRHYYDVHSYRRAISRACEKAEVPAWHPHQLRHARATEIRRQYGVEIARVLLGHQTLAATEIYAEQDFAAAIAVAAKVG